MLDKESVSLPEHRPDVVVRVFQQPERMSVFNVDSLLEPINEESPCGEDLEYDPDYTNLERSAQGKPEQVMGDSVVAAEEPDWAEVRDQAESLFGRTKDLRVAALLTRAAMHREGLAGFAAGVALVRGVLERYWDEVHPRLDPEDDNDPTMRVNTLVELADPELTLDGLRRVPLVSSRAMGQFSLRDIRIAKGELTPAASEGEEAPAAPDPAQISAAFMDADLEELRASAETIATTAENVATIESFTGEKVGVTEGPDLSALTADLKEMGAVLAEKLTERGVTDAPGAEEGAGPGGGPAAAAPLSGDIRSREDVVRLLDKACEYFRRNEPSSPVPLLLERAKRLVSKDFLEIIRDLTPDAVSQAESIRGATED